MTEEGIAHRCSFLAGGPECCTEQGCPVERQWHDKVVEAIQKCAAKKAGKGKQNDS